MATDPDVPGRLFVQTPALGRPPGRKPTAYQRRVRAITTLHRWRHLVQLVVVALIVALAIRHETESTSGAPSVDALCPFGAVETMWTWVTTGSFISKIHPSNIAVGLGLLAAVLVAGNAFCGWICPFGAIQDALHWLKEKLHVPTVAIPPRVDRVLRYGRFVVLGVVLVASATTLSLWFADVDPYVTLFGLSWVFEPDLATMWPALAILVGILGASMLVERAWCRYLCPLGGVLSVLGRFSVLRIRRSASACTDCNLCNRPCPVGIDVAKAAPVVGADCIGCLECVASCPKAGALEVTAAPPWAGLRKPFESSRAAAPSGPALVAINGRRPATQKVGAER
jgi:NapH/MauN family ferredoxin-type protein